MTMDLERGTMRQWVIGRDGVKRWADTNEPVQSDEELLDLLDAMFSAYEDGPDCYEDPDEQAGYVGKAVKLDDATFHRIADILNRRRPRVAHNA